MIVVSNCTTDDSSVFDLQLIFVLVYSLISSTLSTSNYDATLVGWGAQSGSVISGVNIHFGNSEYTSGSLADQRRQDLIDAGWTITDGGYA